jgi:hypothetical protein
MSMERLHLRKLLQLFYADRSKRRSIILTDIRSDVKRTLDPESRGGDFYVPFWADAKDHVAGKKDLSPQAFRADLRAEERMAVQFFRLKESTFVSKFFPFRQHRTVFLDERLSFVALHQNFGWSEVGTT